MKKITATVPAWITNGYTTLSDIEQGNPVSSLGSLSYYSFIDGAPEDWFQVGTAEIIFTPFEPAKVIEDQIATLKQAKQKIQAETQAKLNAIDERIGSLLCLEHKPATEADACHERHQQ